MRVQQGLLEKDLGSGFGIQLFAAKVVLHGSAAGEVCAASRWTWNTGARNTTGW